MENFQPVNYVGRQLGEAASAVGHKIVPLLPQSAQGAAWGLGNAVNAVGRAGRKTLDVLGNVATGKGSLQNLLQGKNVFTSPKALGYNTAAVALPIAGPAMRGEHPDGAVPTNIALSAAGLQPAFNIAHSLGVLDSTRDRYSGVSNSTMANIKDIGSVGDALVSAPFSPIRRLQLQHGVENLGLAFKGLNNAVADSQSTKAPFNQVLPQFKDQAVAQHNKTLDLAKKTISNPNASETEKRRAKAIIGRSPEALAEMIAGKAQQAAEPALDVAKATPEQLQQHFPQMQEQLKKIATPQVVEELKTWDGKTPLSQQAQALQQHSKQMADAVNKMGFQQYQQLTGGKGTPQEFVQALNGANPNDPMFKTMVQNVDKELANTGQPPQARQAALNHILDMPTPAKVAIVMGLGLGIASMIGGDFMAGAALLGAGVLGGQMLGGNLGALAGKATGRPQAPGVPMPGSLTQDQMGKDKTYQLLAQGQHGTIPPDQIVQHLARLRPEALDAILQQNPALKPFAAQAAQLRTQGQAYVAGRQNAQALGRQAAQQQAQSLRQTAAKVGLPADPAGFQQFMAANRNNPQALTDAVAKLRAADPQAPAQMAQMIRQGLRDNNALNPDGSIRKAYLAADERVRDAQVALNALGG